ncbi:sugar phosphate nucleotidyltransferase [Undibacterium sp. Di26W]|uniref:sugar phosphate nucleotidyltransferase n=1 Tax=Undibacterium sp. Di26W TaxID=3413035 RepID=UPI003BF1B29C
MNKSINEFADVPVVILCGGIGVTLNVTHGQRLNKGLVQIQGKPLFWWVMLQYVVHGARDFILAAGVQHEQFDQFLKNSEATQLAGDISCYELKIGQNICRVRIVVTEPDATTAARLLACQPFLQQKQHFALTYSDTLSDVDLTEEIRLHKRQNLVATMVATKLPVRFRILGIRTGETLVRAFASRPVIEAANINGGYYVFSHRVWEAAFGLSNQLALENQPLELLAAAGQLNSFAHNGGWQTCDAERDIAQLSRLASYLESAAQADN